MSSTDGVFSIRLVIADFYMEKPIYGLDACYSEFRGKEIKRVPIIRIFGANANGQKTCMHIHGVFPYFYVPYDQKQCDSLNKAMYQIATNVDKAINISLGQATSAAQHVFKIQLVKGIPFYGYHRAEHQFLKIYMYNPRFVKRAANLLQNGAVMGKNFHPHESHVPYILQFMIDYNLYGMSLLHVPLEVLKFRRNNEEEAILYSGIKSEQILNTMNAKKISSCKLEVDVSSNFILNRFQLMTKSYASNGSAQSNPGIAAIWNDEKLRRQKLMQSLADDEEKFNAIPKLEVPPPEERPHVLPAESETFYRTALLAKLLSKDSSLVGSGDLADQTLNCTLQSNVTNTLPADMSSKERKRTFNLRKVIGDAIYPEECSQGDALVNASFVQNHLSHGSSSAQESFLIPHSNEESPQLTPNAEVDFHNDTIVDEELVLHLTQAANVPLNATLREEDMQLLDVLQQLEEQSDECNQIDLDSTLAPLSQQQSNLEFPKELLDKKPTAAMNNHSFLEETDASHDDIDDDDDENMHDFTIAMDDLDELIHNLTQTHAKGTSTVESAANLEAPKIDLPQLDGADDPNLLLSPKRKPGNTSTHSSPPRTPKTPKNQSKFASPKRSPRTPKSSISSRYAPLPLVITNRSDKKNSTSALNALATPPKQMRKSLASHEESPHLMFRKKFALTEIRRKSVSDASELQFVEDADGKSDAEDFCAAKKSNRRSRKPIDLDKTHITCALMPRRTSAKLLKVYQAEKDAPTIENNKTQNSAKCKASKNLDSSRRVKETLEEKNAEEKQKGFLGTKSSIESDVEPAKQLALLEQKKKEEKAKSPDFTNKISKLLHGVEQEEKTTRTLEPKRNIKALNQNTGKKRNVMVQAEIEESKNVTQEKHKSRVDTKIIKDTTLVSSASTEESPAYPKEGLEPSTTRYAHKKKTTAKHDEPSTISSASSKEENLYPFKPVVTSVLPSTSANSHKSITEPFGNAEDEEIIASDTETGAESESGSVTNFRRKVNFRRFGGKLAGIIHRKAAKIFKESSSPIEPSILDAQLKSTFKARHCKVRLKRLKKTMPKKVIEKPITAPTCSENLSWTNFDVLSNSGEAAVAFASPLVLKHSEMTTQILPAAQRLLSEISNNKTSDNSETAQTVESPQNLIGLSEVKNPIKKVVEIIDLISSGETRNSSEEIVQPFADTQNPEPIVSSDATTPNQTPDSGSAALKISPLLTFSDSNEAWKRTMNINLVLTDSSGATDTPKVGNSDLKASQPITIVDSIALTNEVVAITPLDSPPTYEEVIKGCQKLGIQEHEYQQPFYGNPRDVTKAKEVGHTMLHIPGNKLNDVPEFQSLLGADLKGLTHWRRNKLLQMGGPALLNRFRTTQSMREYFATNKRVIMEPLASPPTRHEAKLWLKAREILQQDGSEKPKNALDDDSPIKIRRQKVTMMLNDEVAGSGGGDDEDCDMDCSMRSLTLTPMTPCTPLPTRETKLQNNIFTPLTTIASASPQEPTSSNKKPFRRAKRSRLSLNKKLKRAHDLNHISIECPLPIADDITALRTSQTSHSSDTSISSQTAMAELERSSFVKRLRSVDSPGQLDSSFGLTAATLNNTFGFKVDLENLQEAKSDIEYNYLTTIVMEVFALTRGDLCPNPEFDEIRCIFYAIENSIPTVEVEENCIEQKQLPLKACGYIIVNDAQDIVPELGNTHGLDADIEMKVVKTEIDALSAFLELCAKWDPDIYAGYEIEMSSWGYLMDRAKYLCLDIIPLLSRVPTQKVRESKDEDRETLTDLDVELKLCGRILLDVWRLMRSEIALTSYTFENVMYHILHKRCPFHSYRDLGMWFASPCSRWIVLEYFLERVRGILALLNQLDLIGRTSEMAKLIGIQFYEVLSRGSQFRVESMMLRIAKPKNIVPLSPSVQQRAHMRAPEYLPLILEPQSRFYADPLIVLDFQSLYPSIIIAYNYCFSTCLGRVEHLGQSTPFEFGAAQLRVSPTMLQKFIDDDLINISPCGVVFVKQAVREGILPRMLTEILDTRLMVKQSMKLHKSSSALKRILHSRQLGLKLMANVTYGYTAANFSGRMPAVEVGDSVVAKGRETLERAIKVVEANEKWNVRVVYGDTDSLFVLVPGRSRDEAFKIGEEIAETITNLNPHPVKLKLEKVYQPCILQTKKRYVGYMYETPDQTEPVYEAKGIETVRRDGCPAVAKMLEKVLRILFETTDVSQVKHYVCRQFKKLLSGRANIQDLIFAKEFRGLNGYKPTACVPALELTRRWIRTDPRRIPRRGERVPFIIANGPPGVPLIRLIRSPQEMLSDEGLKINAIYYITKAIIPPLNRCLLLIGADVHEWFTNLPRKLLLTPALSMGNEIIASSSTNQQKKSTISQYFSSTQCIIDCGRQTKRGICDNCQQNPLKVFAVVQHKIARIERGFHLTQQICQACCGRVGDLNCGSLDCPVLYVLEMKRRDLKQITHFQNMLDERF